MVLHLFLEGGFLPFLRDQLSARTHPRVTTSVTILSLVLPAVVCHFMFFEVVGHLILLDLTIFVA